MEFTSIARINSLYWITSLNPEQQGVTRRIIEDLTPFFEKIELPFRILEPKSVAELVQMLQQIAADAKTGAKPIIHFDTHGDAKNGIYVDAEGKFLSFDRLGDLLRSINIATANNLCVVSTACFSLHMIHEVAIDKPCPFFILLAPETEIAAGLVESQIVPFYMDVFTKLNILSAHDTHLKEKFKAFHAERMFLIALARYFRRSCIGAGARKRREDLISQAIAGGIANTPRNRKLMRKSAKEGIKPSAQMMARYAHRFLIGRKSSFGFLDVMKLVHAPDKK